MDTIDESELNVTFYPELYLQRRVWVLNFLRKYGITRVLDVGCGEGALINTLCQPAPWLSPPPMTILPASPTSSLSQPGSPSASMGLPLPTYTCKQDDIPNLHMREVHGLDISTEDLIFAMEAASPPERKEEDDSEMGTRLRALTIGAQRWEPLTSKVWNGGLEVINEEFKDIECIVGMEVIEHLPENIFKTFAPTLLGAYHPKYLLITTPSYTYNARFTAPDAPSSSRQGFPDPTGRTDRVFRHSDHKFEWTREEFQAWCQEAANEWGYEVNETTIGHALEADPWDRDAILQGATQVAAFYRIDRLSNENREEKARKTLSELGVVGQAHECLGTYQHRVNPAAIQPKPLEDIAMLAKDRMEKYRLAFMRMEELWFEPDIGAMCGGWIEMLVRAVEDSQDLNLKRDVDGVRTGRSMWNVELVGGISSSPWKSEIESMEEDIPEDWIPGDLTYASGHRILEDSDMECSTGADGDVSAGEDDEEWVPGWGIWTSPPATEKTNGLKGGRPWGDGEGVGWGEGEADRDWNDRIPLSAMSSTAGWDGDESEDTS